MRFLVRHKCKVCKVKAYQTKRSKPGACLVLSEVLKMPSQSGRTTRCHQSRDQNAWVLGGFIRFSLLLNK